MAIFTPLNRSKNGLRSLRSARVMLVLATSSSALALIGTTTPASATASPATGYALSVVAGFGAQGAPTPGVAPSSRLNRPTAVATDAVGDVYIADSSNNVIEKVTSSGELSIVAGNGQAGVPTQGPATSSNLNTPEGVAVDSSGNVFIADTLNNMIEKVTPSGALSIVAGSGVQGTPAPGLATSSPLHYPRGVAVDVAGNLYISNGGSDVVAKVEVTGTLSILAGNGSYGAPKPGAATSSPLGLVVGVAVDSAKNVYLADESNNVIEKVTASGTLSIVAGNGNAGTPTAGPATSSTLAQPDGIAIDAAGTLYISDTGNSLIEKVTSSGALSIIAGSGTQNPPVPGLATASPLTYPGQLRLDPGGDVFVAANLNYEVLKLAPATVPGAPSGVIATPSSTNASVSWTASTSTGGLPITGYTVTAVDTTKAARGGQTVTGFSPMRVLGLTNGDSYSFKVTANNALGAGPASSASAAIVPASRPSPPTSVSAAPGFNSVVLSWAPPASNGFSPITGYKVYETTNGPPSGGQFGRLLVATTGPSARSATVTGLPAGTTYSFTVQASNVQGDSDPSASVSAPSDVSQLSGATMTLALGQSLCSQNNRYLLVLQIDGNLVEYDVTTSSIRFQTKTYVPKVTAAKAGFQLVLKIGGTLNLLNKSHQSIWSPTTSAATSFLVANDGTLQLKSSSGTVVWKG